MAKRLLLLTSVAFACVGSFLFSPFSFQPERKFSILSTVASTSDYSKIKSAIDNLSVKRINDPRNYDIPYKLGLLTLQSQDQIDDAYLSQQALNYFRDAAELNPLCDGAWYNIAMILEKQQLLCSDNPEIGDKSEDAISAYRQTIQTTKNPQLKSASYNNVIRLYMSMERVDEAAIACNEAVNDNPNDTFAWSNMGIILVQNEAFDWAESCFRSALAASENTNTIALNNLAFLCKRKGKLDEAEMYLRAAVELDSSDVSSFYALGMLLLENGDKPQARKIFENCVALNPDNEQAVFQLKMIDYTDEDALTVDGSSPVSLPTDYVKQLFDFYASAGYEEHMIRGLDYRGPDVMWESFLHAIGEDGDQTQTRARARDWFGIDIGCGTGLLGKRFRSQLKSLKVLIGCDLSSEMVNTARDARCEAPCDAIKQPSDVTETPTNIVVECEPATAPSAPVSVPVSVSVSVYDSVVADDCVSMLRGISTSDRVSSVSSTPRHRNVYPWNLVLAGDVLPYVGDLSALFAAVVDVLQPGGIFIFTVEELQDVIPPVPYQLTGGGRFAHSRQFVEELAIKMGMKILVNKSVVLRSQNGDPVDALVFALGKQL